ncbi:MAG: hypothetical protein LAQ69_02205 [Acidobacteriia bacterium]|nr:hypothetical protein [Terriglobia bacterium]
MQGKVLFDAIARGVFAALFAADLFSLVPAYAQAVPKTWDERALETGVIQPPVAHAPVKHIPADYYYRMRERVIYRTYPVYSSKREPPGYLEKLALAEPEVVFDAGKLHTEQDWIGAGKQVFRYPIGLFPVDMLAVWRTIMERTGVPVARDGTYPHLSIVVPKKGVVMAGFLSCATCHTRIQPDGSVIEGGQGTVPDLLLGFPPDVQIARAFQRALFRVPWIDNDPIDRVQKMSIDEINAIKAAMPLGVVARHGTSLFTPVQIPDLIGVRERRYLDRTGLMRHRDIGDMMRYAALNQGADMLSDYAGYRPVAGVAPVAGLKDDHLPPPEALERYSDPQLFALAKYVYSLAPPPNPNGITDPSRRGEAVFAREGCARCHTPPLYNSNKLTPARGFEIPEEHRRTYEIEPTIVGTDTDLTMRTRRGTGYYKIPSLLGVWYRGPFEHSGSVATLEDWFDAKRLRSDYVPTGFRGFGVEHRAVPGHPFGLNLSADDKAALIAFLKTL